MNKLNKKSDFKKLTLKKGISLITLVITIVVVIILAVVVILNLSSNNLIGNAKLAVIKSDLSECQDAYSIYVGKLMTEKLGSVKGSGTIGSESSTFTITVRGKTEAESIALSDLGIDSSNIEEIHDGFRIALYMM